MRKPIKVTVCIFAAALCAMLTVADYAGFENADSITAEARSNEYGYCIAETVSDYARIYPYPYTYYLSNNKRYRLQFQQDGNLVIYPYCESLNENGKWYWNTRTSNSPRADCFLQPDGNLVIYDKSGHAVWNSETCSKAKERLEGTKRLYLNDQGELVITFQKKYSFKESRIWISSDNTKAIFNSQYANFKPHEQEFYKLAGYYPVSSGPHSGKDAYIKIHLPNPDNRYKCRVDYYRVGYNGSTMSGTMYIPRDSLTKTGQSGAFYYRWQMWPASYGNMEAWELKDNEGYSFHCNKSCTIIAGVGLDRFTEL